MFEVNRADNVGFGGRWLYRPTWIIYPMTKQQTVSKIGAKGHKSPKSATQHEYRNGIMNILTRSRKGKFTQKDLRTTLKCSNSYCNKSLRKLLGSRNIVRTMVGNKFFYQFKKAV